MFCLVVTALKGMFNLFDLQLVYFKDMGISLGRTKYLITMVSLWDAFI